MLSVTGGTTGPGSGTTGPRHYRPCYRHQQKAPAQVPGRQAVLPARKRYYRMTGTTGRAGPVLPDLEKPERNISAQRLVPNYYTFSFRMTGTTGRSGPVLPDLEKPKRVNSAQRLVTLSIFRYLFPNYPCLCGWPIYSPHPPL